RRRGRGQARSPDASGARVQSAAPVGFIVFRMTFPRRVLLITFVSPWACTPSALAAEGAAGPPGVLSQPTAAASRADSTERGRNQRRIGNPPLWGKDDEERLP